MSALLLFDLDGTLTRTPAGRRAFRRAFAEVAGLEDCDRGVEFAGKTDPALFREILERHGIRHVTPEQIAPVYLRLLETELAQEPGRVLPGVPALLAALSGRTDCRLALGTGNLEAGARLKLARHGLNRYFPTGGFGSDAEVRAELIRAGIVKAERHYGHAFDRVVVIGDSPLDVACGQANGAATLAVATGPYGAAALTAAGADQVLADFNDLSGALSAIQNLTS